MRMVGGIEQAMVGGQKTNCRLGLQVVMSPCFKLQCCMGHCMTLVASFTLWWCENVECLQKFKSMGWILSFHFDMLVDDTMHTRDGTL